MDPRQHLWDVLRDLLGLAPRGRGQAAAAQTARRAELAALNDELAASAARVRERDAELDRAELQQAAALQATLHEATDAQHDAAGQPEGGRAGATHAQGHGQTQAPARGQDHAQALAAELDAVRARAAAAQAAHQALRQRRDALLERLRATTATAALPDVPDLPDRAPAPAVSAPAAGSAPAEQRLRERMAAASDLPGAAGALALRALAQLDGLRAKADDFERLRAARLAPEEFASLRFAATVAGLRRAVLGRLAEVIDAAEALRELDPTALRARLQALPASAATADADDAVTPQARLAATLRVRLALHATHSERAERLLAQNEEALTALLQASAALAAMGSGERETREFHQLVEDLEDLARRASSYND